MNEWNVIPIYVVRPSCFSFFSGFSGLLTLSLRIVFAPILPLVEDEFMINHALASSIFIFLSAGYGAAVIVAGFFSGKFGYKKSIVLSLGLLGLVAFLVPLVQSFYLLYLFAFVIGFSVGFYLPSAIPLITEYYSEKNWGKAIAIHDTGAPSAIFATPFVALFLLHFFPWRGIFIVLACIYLVCSIVFCFVSSEVKVSNPPKTVFSDLIKIKSLWLMAIIWVFGAGANLGIYSIVPLYLTKELQLNIGYANTILGFSRLGAVGMAIACGFLMDRFNLRKIMFIVMIITGGPYSSHGIGFGKIYWNRSLPAGVLCDSLLPGRTCSNRENIQPGNEKPGHRHHSSREHSFWRGNNSLSSWSIR